LGGGNVCVDMRLCESTSFLQRRGLRVHFEISGRRRRRSECREEDDTDPKG
jgi:hypothetical protein